MRQQSFMLRVGIDCGFSLKAISAIRVRSQYTSILLLFILLTACGGGQTSLTPVAQLPQTAGPVSITFIGLPSGVGYEIDRRLIDQFTQETGILVKFVPGPESSTERQAQYLEFLDNHATEPDVYQIDIVWVGDLAEHMFDLNAELGAEAQAHFQTIVNNNTVDGKLIGMPFYTDAGLLFYRIDLLKKYDYAGPPETWDELEAMASAIQAGERAAGNDQFWGFVWQGTLHEGLTCNALEWQVSLGGGQIIEPDKTITVNNPRAVAALEMAAGWIGVISPPGVTAYRSEDSRNVWQAGNAAFMRNWPYAYAKGQEAGSPVRGKFDVTLLPSGGAEHAATLGGWQLAVSKYSTHPQEAIQFVRYMTSPQVQLQRSVEGSFLPTIPELYDDPQVLAANPYYSRLKEVFFGGAVARPSTVSGKLYSQVSKAYFTAVHAVLTGEASSGEALANLETELTTITGFKTDIP